MALNCLNPNPNFKRKAADWIITLAHLTHKKWLLWLQSLDSLRYEDGNGNVNAKEQ